MPRTFDATIVAYLLFAIWPAPAQSAGGSVGAGGATGSSGLADWWWIILVVVVIGVGIWYFTSRKGRL
jgi:hypothetical protein